MDLGQQPWKTVNRLLATCASAQVLAFRAGKAAKGWLLGDRSSRFTSPCLKVLMLPVLVLGRLLTVAHATRSSSQRQPEGGRSC
jgi:hypothetical protein